MTQKRGSTMCVWCRHFRIIEKRMACAAFPDHIPDAIFYHRSFDHREPYPGDQGIQFEPAAIADLMERPRFEGYSNPEDITRAMEIELHRLEELRALGYVQPPFPPFPPPRAPQGGGTAPPADARTELERLGQITLSDEELLVLCRRVRLPVELRQSWVHTLPPEQQQLVLRTAERALTARGLAARISTGLFIMPSDLHMLVEEMSGQIWGVALRVVAPAHPPIQAFAYLNATPSYQGDDDITEMGITHYVRDDQLRDGVLHVLRQSVDFATALDELLALLALPATPVPDPPLTVTLPTALLQEAVARSAHDPAAAQALLAAVDTDPVAGARLRALVGAPVQRAEVRCEQYRIRHPRDPETLTLLSNHTGSWLIRPAADDAAGQTLQLVNAAQVLMQVEMLLWGRPLAEARRATTPPPPR